MPDAMMYQEEMFVVLMPGAAEECLTPEELLERLTEILRVGAASPVENRQLDLPRDLQRFSTVAEQAQHLRDTACELELSPGETMQWYVVRLEK
ncbi:chlororespiratory reduction protein 7 [Nodosilinea sp. LEGE 06152]|uniref:chlororespiratory reduction protein 7 n=1 Tax=Nodosilinea sp. LEGE 06152 TaxID=2777966 RepID=UPI00187DE8E4|nr:chlororespiratory reduction protein 7 [Nodosilinea sp. LEGE 06152]MBE9158146.1 chlororespiratory reduction protein 7 [Nodosilinea sp. LEGE 06152]